MTLSTLPFMDKAPVAGKSITVWLSYNVFYSLSTLHSHMFVLKSVCGVLVPSTRFRKALHTECIHSTLVLRLQ